MMFEEHSTMTVITVASAVATFFTAYYSLYVSQKPKVFATNSKLKSFLKTHVKSLQQKFYPSPFLIEGRLQTIFSLSQRVTSPSKLPYERELFGLSDGGEVGLDYLMAEKEQSASERPFLILFLPGLTSSSQSSYVRTLVLEFVKVGASVVVFNNRGNGGVAFKTPKTYSASYIGDLEEVIAHLKQKFPNHRLMALGTSLGGMVLSKYLISKPEAAKENLECAILVSIVWDCVRGSENLEKPFINKYLINKALTLGLVRLGKRFLSNFKDIPLKFDPKEALKAKTVREFDAAVTAPQFGFPNVDEYYKSATSSGNIHKYSIPVFGLNAEDDPMHPGNLLPRDEASAPGSKLALITTARGGHLAWLEGFTKHSTHYMERVLAELVRAIRLYGTEELSAI